MRLIDADALIQVLCVNMDTGQQFDRATHCVDVMPTVDAVPVKHGRWLVNMFFIQCSECGEPFPLKPQNYCPHCGARMDEAKEENE